MNDELILELVEDSANRAGTYNLLSSLYLMELTSEQISALKDQDLESIKGMETNIDAGLNSIARYLKASFGKDIRQELASDYAHSILGVTADEHEMALPYESLYFNGEKLLMRECRDDVYRMYCEEHMGTPEGKDIPEDHLGLMFEFMGYLCTEYNNALNRRDYQEALRLANKEKELLAHHVLYWIDKYCDLLLEVARTGFYRGLAQITRGWMNLEQDAVENVILDTQDLCGVKK